MDFDELYHILPKASITWTIKDIENWLRFIGLESYIDSFKNASVDGSCLSELTEEDIKNQLKITSKIIIKKILTWITQGIKNYDAFLSNKEKASSSFMKSQYQIKISESQSMKIDKNKEKFDKFEEIYDLKVQYNEKKMIKRESTEMQKQKKELNELIIKQCDSNSVFSYYSLKEQGGMIGRNNKSQICLMDESISRNHAQIEYENGEYYIRDFGSSTGTFMRITEKTLIYHGIILEMGSNQFYVEMNSERSIVFKVIEGPNVGEPISLPNKTKINIGRKATNQINFPDDQHLSNIHSTIFQVEDAWYIEDLGTTNGTWIRLSPQGIKSERHLLQNLTQFKLGTSLTYECQLANSNRKTEKEKSDKCGLCKISEKNCIFIPCKHNVCCHKCAQFNELVNCISCNSAITELMKIFKV